jgi:hypothetical protein
MGVITPGFLQPAMPEAAAIELVSERPAHEST